jgi:hypothetical protein
VFSVDTIRKSAGASGLESLTGMQSGLACRIKNWEQTGS